MKHPQQGAVHFLGIALIIGLVYLAFGAGNAPKQKPVSPPVNSTQSSSVPEEINVPGAVPSNKEAALINYCQEYAKKGVKSEVCEAFWAGQLSR